MTKQGNRPATRVGTNFFVFLNKSSKPTRLFFLRFLKRGKQNQAKETKQTKNKLKIKEVKDSPCEYVLSLPGNSARKLVDDSLMAPENLAGSTSLETPRARCDEHNSKSSLSTDRG